MKTYQMFTQYFRMLEKEFEDRGLKEIDIHLKESRKKFYGQIGLTDDDKIKQYEYRKTREMNDAINLGLEMAHVFEVDTIIKRYLILNKPPQTKEFYKRVALPFKSIFLDVEIDETDYDIGVNKINGMLILETPLIAYKEDTKGLKFETLGRAYRVYYLCVDNSKFFIDEFKIVLDNTNVPIFYDDKKTLKFLKEFIMNLLVFINDREIQIVERKRNTKNMERRARQGKPVLPDSKVIKLTGVLKKYIDSIGSGLSGKHYNYRFYVRGHMRYLISERYKNKKGQWIKIEPYIKGEGILVERTYRVTNDKEDERINELKKENLFYDDIEPLKKPLRKTR